MSLAGCNLKVDILVVRVGEIPCDEGYQVFEVKQLVPCIVAHVIQVVLNGDAISHCLHGDHLLVEFVHVRLEFIEVFRGCYLQEAKELKRLIGKLI